MMLYVETPLIYSAPLSHLINRAVYLKLENTQPSGSFKLRGISNCVQSAVRSGAKHIVIASGGNAGIATAYVAYQLGIKATVFTVSTLSQDMLKKFHDLGCEIYDGGVQYDNCVITLKKYMEEHREAVHIHPFDDELIWEGNATMIHEAKRQLDQTPGVVISCIGGGGLLCGIARGMDDVGWHDVPLVAMETCGAESFNMAVKAGKPATMAAITSIAHTLAALTVCERVVQYSKERRIISRVIPDKEAVQACALFLRDHNMLVEPACGATLSVIYNNRVNQYLYHDNHVNGEVNDEVNDDVNDKSPVVVIVCGGATITKDGLYELVKEFNINLDLPQHYSLPVRQCY